MVGILLGREIPVSKTHNTLLKLYKCTPSRKKKKLSKDRRGSFEGPATRFPDTWQATMPLGEWLCRDT